MTSYTYYLRALAWPSWLFAWPRQVWGNLLFAVQALCFQVARCHFPVCTQGVTAFLERTNWAKACGGEARPLLPGTLMEVVVTAAPKQARMLPCCPPQLPALSVPLLSAVPFATAFPHL